MQEKQNIEWKESWRNRKRNLLQFKGARKGQIAASIPHALMLIANIHQTLC
jgi:hypothetical protein